MRYGAVQVLPAGNTVDETSCYKSSNTIYVTSLFLSFPRMVSQGRGVQLFILPEKNIIDNHFVHNFIIGRLKSISFLCNRFHQTLSSLSKGTSHCSPIPLTQITTRSLIWYQSVWERENCFHNNKNPPCFGDKGLAFECVVILSS